MVETVTSKAADGGATAALAGAPMLPGGDEDQHATRKR